MFISQQVLSFAGVTLSQYASPLISAHADRMRLLSIGNMMAQSSVTRRMLT